MPSGGGQVQVADNDPSNPLTASEVEVPTIDAPMSMIEKLAVPIVFTIFVVFRAADRVFMKSINNDLGKSSYNEVFSNIIWPFAMQIITMCIIAGYVVMQRCQGNMAYNLSFFKLNQPLASSTGAIPTYMLALFSLGDQLNAALSAPASPFVSQPIQSVMTNFILIWMAFVAYFWINVRYKMVHYMGMALVILGILIQFAPYVLQNDCSTVESSTLDPPSISSWKGDGLQCFSAYHSPGNCTSSHTPEVCGLPEVPCPKDSTADVCWQESTGSHVILQPAIAMVFFYILFLVSTAPAAVSNVYKQKVLQGVDADIFYVTWWSGWFQLLWGWVAVPLMWIPLPGQDPLGPASTFTTIISTFQCIAGDVSAGETCASGAPPWVYVLLYFGFNATFNLCITWLIKRISATWVQVATVLCLNLCNILSTQHWIVGNSAEPMTAWDWTGALVVSLALVVYNLQPEVTLEGKEILQQAAGSFVADGHANLIEKLSGTTPTGSFVKPGSFVGK